MSDAQITDFYILFHNHTEGMQLYSYLRQRQLRARICPVPRAASACCGMSLIVEKEDFPAVWAESPADKERISLCNDSSNPPVWCFLR